MHTRAELDQESVVLAKFLMDVCLKVAAKDPSDHHAAFLGYRTVF